MDDEESQGASNEDDDSNEEDEEDEDEDEEDEEVDDDDDDGNVINILLKCVFIKANKKIEYENKNQIVKLAFVEDDDDDGGGSPFDDENDLQDLVEDAIYRFPLGDHDTGKFQGSIYIFDG